MTAAGDGSPSAMHQTIDVLPNLLYKCSIVLLKATKPVNPYVTEVGSMVDIKQFVDAIHKDFAQYSGSLEKDQMLPPEEALLEVCQTLLNAFFIRLITLSLDLLPYSNPGRARSASLIIASTSAPTISRPTASIFLTSRIP